MRRSLTAAAILCVAAAGAGCGTESRSAGPGSAEPTATNAAQELPCGKLPPEANCPGPMPPKPVPTSPSGPVRTFESEYWSSEETDSDNGVFEVAVTAPGTFAETGLVHDVRSGQDDPVEGATVTYETVQGPGLAPPPGGGVRVSTKTGYGGAYAFIDLPVASGGTCYRLVISAPDVGRYEAVDVIEPGAYDHSGLELDGSSQTESYLDTTRGKAVPPIYRTCAAQASR